MQTIRQNYLINAPVEGVWQALVDPKIIDEWGGGDAEMNATVGFEFHLWNGDIFGSNLEVTPLKKLVQNWYSGAWEKPSKVIITLKSKDKKTLLTLLHENYPPEEYEQLDMGWKEFYLGPMKKYLESKK
jgi:uncharacterized protein YndB with AHSA1/START domain